MICETNVVGDTSRVNSTTPANAIQATAQADGNSLSIEGLNTGGADRIACLRCVLVCGITLLLFGAVAFFAITCADLANPPTPLRLEIDIPARAPPNPAMVIRISDSSVAIICGLVPSSSDMVLVQWVLRVSNGFTQ